jgi:hypothetical protein
MRAESQHRANPRSQTVNSLLVIIERVLLLSFVALSMVWLASYSSHVIGMRWVLFLIIAKLVSFGSGKRTQWAKASASRQSMSERQASAKAREIAFMLVYSLSEETRAIMQRFAPSSDEPRQFMRAYVELVIFCVYLVQRQMGSQFSLKAKVTFEGSLLATTYDLLSQQLNRQEPDAESKFTTLYVLRAQQYDSHQSMFSSQDLGLLPNTVYANLRGHLKFIAKEERMLSLLRSLGTEALKRAETMRGQQ